MKTEKYLVLNTVHVRCSTAELMTVWAQQWLTEQPMAVSPTPCGWFLPTSLNDDRLLPPELPGILAFGRDHGCSYVLLDSDGEVVPELPVFPW